MARDESWLAAIRAVRSDAAETLRVFRGMRESTEANGPAKVILTPGEMYYILDSATSVIERYMKLVDTEATSADSGDGTGSASLS